MKTKALTILIAFGLFAACVKVPITGRRQINLLPQSTLNSMSLTEYRAFLNANTVVSASDNQTLMVQTVGKKIADAASLYLRTHGNAKRLAGYKWEFNLVQSPEANAWCMPGGKVVVYTGLLAITKTPEGLAVVLGHEISHSLANHGNERMSQQLGVQVGGLALDVALSQKPQQTRDIFMQSYGIGSTLGMLKYSRVHESEADRLGLTFMAMAGYNPNEAIGFWQRMSSQGGAQPPEFLSTHPSHSTRIEDIKKWMPEAMKHYKPSGGVIQNNKVKQPKTPPAKKP
jgi:predicted Zn-dependent protease